MFKKLLLTGALALGLASAAHADTFVATGIGTPDSFGFGGFSIGTAVDRPCGAGRLARTSAELIGPI